MFYKETGYFYLNWHVIREALDQSHKPCRTISDCLGRRSGYLKAMKRSQYRGREGPYSLS